MLRTEVCLLGKIRELKRIQRLRNCRLITAGFVPTFDVGTTVKRRKHRQHPEIYHVLDKIPHATPTEKLHIDHMTRLARDLNWERCTTQLYRSLEKGIRTANTFNVVLYALVASNEIERALGLYEIMKEKQIEPDDTSYQLLFFALSKSSSLPKSFRRGLTLQLLENADFMNTETLRSGFQSLNNCGGSTDVITKYMASPEKIEEETMPEVLRAYRKESRIDEAFRISESFSSTSETLLPETIRLHCATQNFESAYTLLGDVESLASKEKSDVLDAYFHGCAEFGAWNEAANLVIKIEEIRQQRDLLRYEEFVCLIKACSRGGQLEIATAFLEKLKRIKDYHSRLEIEAFFHLLEAFLHGGYLEDFDELFSEVLEEEILVLHSEDCTFTLTDWEPICIFGALRYILFRWQQELGGARGDYKSPGLTFEVGEDVSTIFHEMQKFNVTHMEPQLLLTLDKEKILVSSSSIDDWLMGNPYEDEFEKELMNLQ